MFKRRYAKTDTGVLENPVRKSPNFLKSKEKSH